MHASLAASIYTRLHQLQLDSHAQLYQTAWYSMLGSAPDDERVIHSKHVEQEKTVE